MIGFGRNGHDYVLHNPDTGQQLIIKREELKDIGRIILIELNVVSAKLNTGIELFDTDSKLKILSRHGKNFD